jgi:ABC-type hemin transport system ATPase subunit
VKRSRCSGGNGAGKTTLFRTVLGLLPVRAGTIDVDGVPIASLSAAQRAMRVAYVPQQHVPAYAFSVTDAVLMGRASHIGTFARPGRQDRLAVADALAALGIGALGSATRHRDLGWRAATRDDRARTGAARLRYWCSTSRRRASTSATACGSCASSIGCARAA